MGLPPERARASIRFSVGKHNSEDDIDFALSVIPATIARLRELSPTYSR
jgi:cysteine desulfurase